MLSRTGRWLVRPGSCQLAGRRRWHSRQAHGYVLDLTGKVAFVAGVADASGYGWAVAKQLANAGATIVVGTWPPAMVLLKRELRRAPGDRTKLIDGSDLEFDKVYPLDATFSTPADIPDETRADRRFAAYADYDIKSCAAAVARDYGKIDILVHSLANGPEVTKPLLETSRAGYNPCECVCACLLRARGAPLIYHPIASTFQ